MSWVSVVLGGEEIPASKLVALHRLEATSEFIRGTAGQKANIYNDIVRKELHNFETDKANLARSQLQ